MSGCGFRGRGFGPRGARANGPTTGFGPRFSHPKFNFPRPPPNRLPGPDNWIERPNFPPWQPNANFPQRPQFRGNLQFRPNGRGRAPNARGMVRFSGPGRPPGPQFHFVRNIRPRAPAPQEEQIHENPNPVPEPQAPLLGSEEERQQKITETADKLKQKLFSITEEDSSTFWEDDLSVIPNSTTEEEIIRRKGIPELKHDPPELDLTFTDFKDIGRVDSNNPKFENVENIDDISNVMFTYTSEVTDKLESTNDEITIISEHNRDVEIIESINNESFVTPGNDEFQEQTPYDLTNAECDIEILNFQSDHIEKSLVSTYSTDTNEISLVTDSNRTAIDLPSIQSANDFSNEASKEAIDAQNASKGPTILQNQDALQDTISHNEYAAETKVQTNDNVLGNLQQAEDNSQTSPMQEINQISVTLPASSQSCSSNFPPVHEEIQSNTVSDLPLPIYSQYNEVHKSGEDKKLKNPFEFQPRIFNAPPRFNPRISGPRCRWTFQQGGKNLFFRGPQRLPIHGNRMPPPRHMVRFPQTDLVPITFDPRAPPPFTPNVPASNHDPQHQTLLPFSPNDLPPSFDPTEPPPNVRSATVPEGQDMLQNVPPFDMRNQSGNVSSSNVEMLQPPVVFDPREPPPRITNIVTTTSETLPNFNPQQPPPKVRNQEETFQPPPIFDPRLSSQERSKLIAPLDTSGSNVMTMNLMETSQVPDYSMSSVAGSFSQLPINIPLPQSYMSNMQLNYQQVLPHTNSGQMVHDYPLPPPPLPKNSMNRKEAINQQHTLNMDDGLEDMQEAMEFAKQVMNMSGEMKKDDHVATLQCTDVPLPSEIPVPNENINISCSVPLDQLNSNVTEKSKAKGNACKSAKDDNHAVKPTSEKKSKKEKVTVEERSIPDLCKNAEDVPLTSEQIRPKVVFNLNCKLKKINKPEEWQYETQVARQRKKSDGKKNNLSKSTNQQKERITEKPSVSYGETAKTSEKLNDIFHHKPHNEKSHAQSSNVTASNNVNEQNLQKSKRQTKKADAPTSESSWKNRVISRFLKMSKNDICNMVNNSSLRKFDIAMKHLVKERRSSLSLEMRNIEDEKMKEYDREEFMNQLNAMLDPSAVVGITDLPTEFIHHLSEVLQLDPMPFESSFSSKDDANLTEPANIKQKSISSASNPECTVTEMEDTMVNLTMEHEDVNIEHRKRSKSQDTIREKTSEVTLSSQNNEYSDNAYHHLDSVHLTLDPIQENSSSRKDNMTEKVHSEIETSHKKQFLFNEADLDNILSEVTERSNSIAKPASSQEPRKSTSETHKTSTSTKARGGSYNSRNESPQFRSRTVADLDDIFSATIARVKPSNKIISLEHSRPRKSTSEDRSTFRVEKYSRWSRKERENPDAFRNLTKEEWEAKYGRSMNTTPSSSCTRRSGSNSSDNLFRERENRNYRSQRYCSSDSPMRHLSISPLARESTSLSNAEKYSNEYNGFEESNKSEQMESCSSDSDTSSTSDGSEETVSPNVTKLLKVIKEKEKIAKKKSLNETIRDEVAAEIEKKWKEKSKHKERKSRKREKRKRDKREKRKKERKKRRKRSSPCDVSKYDDDFEENRLLTEEEIKKEVIVKEEPDELLDTNDTSISGSSTASFMLCNRAIELPLISHIESQDSQMPKQFVSAASTMQLSVNSKPAIAVATTQQPKTKAQLKQMPESSDLGKKKQLGNFVEIAVSNINVANTNNEQNKVKIRSTEIINNAKNVQQDKVLPLSNNSSSQIDLTSNTVEIANTEVQGDNDKSIKVIPSLLNTSSSIVDVNVTNEHNNSGLAVTSTSGSIESKCGFKKIDIKAYKERALQRRLKEQSKSNEVITDSFQSLLDLQSTSASDKPQSELSSMENRMKATVPDTDRGQTKCLESTEETESPVLHQENSYKALEQKSNVESPYVSTEALQNISTRLTDNNGSSVFKSIERSVNQIADSDSTKNQLQCKDSKTSSKPTSTSTVVSKQVLHKSHTEVKSKLPSEEKNSKKPNIVDLNKFKNIRSEGSKELKLKKEKIKKLSEKKKTLIKAEKGKSSNLPEKHAEKHSAIAEQKPEDGMQKAKVTDGKNTSKLDTNTRTDYCDNSELTQNKKTAHTNRVPMIPLFSNVESMSNDENTMKPMAEHEFNREDNNERSHVTTQQDIHDNKNKHDKVTDEKNVTDSVIHSETSESQEMSKEENVDVQGNQTTNEENETRDIKEADTVTTKSNEADDTLRETVLTEDVETKANNSEESFNNDPRKFSATEFGVAEELQSSIDANEESLSVRDCTEINTMANSNIINNIETSKDIGIDKNSIPCTEIDISVTNNMSNSITNTVENILEQDKDNNEFCSNTGISQSTTSEPRKMTECQELQTTDLKSPESSGSPFKGFLVDSIEDDIREASELLNLQINKDVEVKIPEDHEKWLETCLDENFDWKGIKENEKSVCTNDEVPESINRENQNNNADLLQTETRDKNEVPNRVNPENDNVRSMVESEMGKIFVEAGKSLPTMNMHIEETFDENSEPFIILDEYIDDTDGKSIGKLSSTELDLEDCVATDTTVFLKKNFQEKEVDTVFDIKSPDFNSRLFKVLSDVSDRDVDTEVDEEGKGKSDLHLKPSKDNVESKISLECNKSPDLREEPVPSVGTIFEDVSQQSTIIESLPTETSKVHQKSLQADDESESSFKDTTVSYQVTSPVVETSKKLNVPTKAALKKSVDDFLTRDESLGYKSPPQVSSLSEKVDDEVTHTGKNDIELNNNAENELVLHSAIDINVELDPVELGKSRDLDDTSRRKHRYEERLGSKSHRKDDNDSLHRLRNKHKMKHKQDKKRKISEKKIKSAIQSDTVQVVHPNTKESIMARMIEIDVEIHKLMTEKMTLYEMLKSTKLPDNSVQNDNVVKESKEAEVPIVRPHTPSALVSQLIQNIESSPVVSQSTKGIENTSSKDNTTDSQQSGKHKVSSKHEHSGSKRSSSSCNSVEEEVTHSSGSTKSSAFRKKRRQKCEKSGRPEDVSETIAVPQETVEKKQADATRSVQKKIGSTVRQEVTERKVDHASSKSKNQGTVNDVEKKNSQNSEKNSGTRQSSNKTGKRSSETSAVQDPVHESDKSKLSDVRNESTLPNDNENEMRIQNDEETASSTSKVPDNRTSEISSMYSDDSTWESFLQNPGLDAIEQKKPSTGLALLEETYRKEIAKSRKMKAEARKKKKQQLQSLLRPANTLTMEEEELPLCTLYIKKLQQKKSLLDSLDQKADELTPNEDSQVWRNVVEVINAVAEDRIEDLYVEQLEKQSDDNSQNVTTEIPGESGSALNEERSDSKISLNVDTVLPQGEEIKKIASCSSKSSDKIKPIVESNDKVSCEIKHDAVNDSKRHEPTTVSNKVRTESAASSTAKSNESNQEDSMDDVNSSNTKVLVCDSKNEETTVEDSLSKTAENNEPVINLSISTDNDINSQQVSRNPETASSLSKKVREEVTDGNIQNETSSVLMTEQPEKDCSNSDVCSTYEKNAVKLNVVTEKHSSEESNTHKEKLIVHAELQSEKITGNIKLEEDNNVPNNDYFINTKEARGSQKKRKESERSNDTLSEDNFNESSSVIDNTDTSRNEDSFAKKSSKRKRQNSNTPLRRSSRYTEEISKRIKIEPDSNTHCNEQDFQDRNLHMYCPRSKSPTPLSSYDEEAENTPTNVKRNKGMQKLQNNRKRTMRSESEMSTNTLSSNDEFVVLKEDIRQTKERKQYTMSEMMNCKVRLVDSKYTILKPNVHPSVLKKYGITSINLPSICAPADPMIRTLEEIPIIKDTASSDTKHTSKMDSTQQQTVKPAKKCDDTSRSSDEQGNPVKVKKIQKSQRMNVSISDKEEYVESSIDDIPVLMNEQAMVDVARNFWEPDIEIVEEKSIGKTQHQNNLESTLSVIEITDDKEIPRTQYTVHKGPILDIKVFESSFLAASEDGRIYRYSQTSNGILNIYKGHKSAVTCLYVYDSGTAELSKDWMFSGSLDGTLRCYNITSGVQMRDTADIGSPIQCMDQAWGMIFIGTKSGHVSRYHIKSGAIKGSSIQFSDQSVLALKATNEGARRVLIVASRSQPITIRDAQSGLFLRTICGERNHTVYSLMRHNNLIYCGTSSTSILVFDFTNAEQTMQYDAGVGIVCMRLYKRLLFAGCYDGNIYVFDTKDHRLVCSIPGPGNMLLSMEIIDNKIIAGSKDRRLQSWQMPQQVRSLLQKIIQKVSTDTS